MTTETYPRTIAPELDLLEGMATLGALIQARIIAEEDLTKLYRAGGEVGDSVDLIARLARAEYKLRRSLGVPA